MTNSSIRDRLYRPEEAPRPEHPSEYDRRKLMTADEVIELKKEFIEGSKRIEKVGGLDGLVVYFAYQAANQREQLTEHMKNQHDDPFNVAVMALVGRFSARMGVQLGISLGAPEDQWVLEPATPMPSDLAMGLEHGHTILSEMQLWLPLGNLGLSMKLPEVQHG